MFYSVCFGQTNNLEGDAASYDGRIILTSGEEAIGQIVYNERTGVVTFKSGNKSGTYNARHLNGFNFYDPLLGSERIFFSLEFELQDTGQSGDQFFELIRQYKTFAVMIKTDAVASKRRMEIVGTSIDKDRVDLSIVTTVYFVNDNVNIRPYLELSSREITQFNNWWTWHILDSQTKKAKIVDKQLPRSLMGRHYNKVDRFADDKNLEWNDQRGLIEILDYYDSIVSQ